jgi:hypothetical protein
MPGKVLERDDLEHPIPPEWHATFHRIAEAFVERDFTLQDHQIDGVAPIEPATAKFIADNITAYGDNLVSLHPATWEWAVYRWMDGYWELLVDLTTAGEEVSDLTLHARLSDEDRPMLRIWSVHVA